MWCIIQMTDEADNNKPLTEINKAPVCEYIPDEVKNPKPPQGLNEGLHGTNGATVAPPADIVYQTVS